DGTMVSEVMQLGDCNSRAIYQALMNHIFQPYLGDWMDIYLDDLVIYSDTIEDHMQHLRTVIDILHKEKFYLSEHKIQLFQKELKILGHIINDQGIRMDPHKVDSIQQWKVPTNKDLLQGFLGSVGYLAPNIPQLHISTGILSKIAGETVFFRWTFTEQQVFDQIVKLVSDFRHNHRIVLDYSKNVPPINIVTDALASGIGGIVSQGHD
ncbi:DNA/RNA polymerase, partial [Fomitiporia mediterranea MF3/22]